MDPNEALRQLRSAIHDLRTADEKEDTIAALNAAREVAEYAEALDVWLTTGGFRPNDWIGTL